MTARTALATDGNEPDWLSTSEAAQLLDVRVRKLYELIDTGRIPAYKFGRVIRLRRREVLAYLASESGDPDEGSPEA